MNILPLIPLVALTGPGDDGSDRYYRPEACLVSVIDAADVPAQEAGVLTAVEAREGMEAAAGVRLAQIDDSRARMVHRIAEAEAAKAREAAENDVNVRYSRIAAKVAEAEYLQVLEANKLHANTVPQSEVRRKLLEFQKAELAIEQAETEHRAAGFQLQVRTAELESAQADILRRQVNAPFDGVVVEVYKRPGEWVSPGEPVFRMVRMDRLRVETFIHTAQVGPHEVADRPVYVRARLERGRTADFQGKVVFVSPLEQVGGKCLVWAEVANRMEQGQWLLRPGATAELVIELAAPIPQRAAAPPSVPGARGGTGDAAPPRGTLPGSALPRVTLPR